MTNVDQRQIAIQALAFQKGLSRLLADENGNCSRFVDLFIY